MLALFCVALHVFFKVLIFDHLSHWFCRSSACVALLDVLNESKCWCWQNTAIHWRHWRYFPYDWILSFWFVALLMPRNPGHMFVKRAHQWAGFQATNREWNGTNHRTLPPTSEESIMETESEQVGRKGGLPGRSDFTCLVWRNSVEVTLT